MKIGWFLFVLFALEVVSRLTDVVDVCSMGNDEMDSIEIDRHSMISFPNGKYMTCAEFLAMSKESREPMMRCNHFSWEKDDRWIRLLVKCNRALYVRPFPDTFANFGYMNKDV